MPPSYPVTFSVDYPERQLNRLTTFFRIFVVIPIAIILGLLPGSEIAGSAQSNGYSGAIAAGSIIFLPIVLMLLFRKKYPRWWYEGTSNAALRQPDRRLRAADGRRIPVD